MRLPAADPPIEQASSLSNLHFDPSSIMADPFLGEIKAVCFYYAPTGYAFANGALAPISQYAALYSLLGTRFGGDGQSTFALPNLQSRAPVGYQTSSNMGGLTPHILGAVGGSEQSVLSEESIPVHTHSATATAGRIGASLTGSAIAVGNATGTGNATGNISIPVQSGGAATNIPGPTVVIGKPGAAAFATSANSNLQPFAATLATTVSVPISAPVNLSGLGVSVSSPSVGVVVDSTGGGQAFDTLSPFLAVNYIVALEGIYPPHG